MRTLAPSHLYVLSYVRTAQFKAHQLVCTRIMVFRKQYVMNAQRMDFLKDKFADVPDLQEQQQPAGKQRATKPKKRPRYIIR